MSSYEELRTKFDQEVEERRRAMDREARRHFRRDLAAFAAAVAVGSGIGLGSTWLVERAPGPTKARPVCEAAVRTLLETRDPLELQRADLVIRHLDCNARYWLPDAPAVAPS